MSEGTDFGSLEISDDHLRMIASRIHYPIHWDTMAYPTLGDALCEIANKEKCSECLEKQEMTQTCLGAIHDRGI